MATACIGLGSNLGSREANLIAALNALADAPGVSVLAVSSFHDTKPVGGPPQPRYLNAAAVLETSHSPKALLDLLLAIEKRLGRTRAEHWGPRVIDLDLLLYDNAILRQPGLIVPHPEMSRRGFVLAPLCEVAPGIINPQSGLTVLEMKNLVI